MNDSEWLNRPVGWIHSIPVYDEEDVVLALLEYKANQKQYRWFHLTQITNAVAASSPFGTKRIKGRILAMYPDNRTVRKIMLSLLADGLLERRGTGRAGDKFMWRISPRLRVQYSARKIREERSSPPETTEKN